MKNMPIKNLLLVGLFISSHSFGSQMAPIKPIANHDSLQKGLVGLAALGVVAFIAHRAMAEKQEMVAVASSTLETVTTPRLENIVAKPLLTPVATTAEPVVKEEEEEVKEETEAQQATRKFKELYSTCMATPNSWEATIQLESQIPKIQILLKAGAHPNVVLDNSDNEIDTNALKITVDSSFASQDSIFISHVFRKKKSTNLLGTAVIDDIFPLIKSLLQYKADPNLGGHSVLFLANNVETAKLLLAAKANTSEEQNGVLKNVLFEAVVNYRPAPLVDFYIQNGISPIVGHSKWTVLDQLCSEPSYERTEFLGLCAALGLQNSQLFYIESRSMHLGNKQKPMLKKCITDPILKKLILEIEQIYTYFSQLQQAIDPSLNSHLPTPGIPQIVKVYLAMPIGKEKFSLKEAQALVSGYPAFPEINQLDPSKLEEEVKED